MKLIDTFECTQIEKYGDGSEKIIAKGVFKIKEELQRPSIHFVNSQGIIVNSNNKYINRLEEDPFTKGEMFFFEKNYGVFLRNHLRSAKYLTSSLNNIHPLYKSSADIILIEDDGKEYLIIEFNRWSTERQPRSAGEDQLGEDITYILGIWENPLLTDEIIAKIKNIR
jgi:hypothetical protein